MKEKKERTWKHFARKGKKRKVNIKEETFSSRRHMFELHPRKNEAEN